MSIEWYTPPENVDASSWKEVKNSEFDLKEYTRKKAEITARLAENDSEDWEELKKVVQELENLEEFDNSNFDKKEISQEIKNKLPEDVTDIKKLLEETDFVDHFMNQWYQSGDWHRWNQDFLENYVGMSGLDKDTEIWIVQHFQELIGINPDGKFGPDTRAAFVELINPNYFQEKFASNPKFASFFEANEENEVNLNNLSGLTGDEFWELRNAIGIRNIRKMLAGRSEKIDYSEQVGKAAVRYGLDVRDLNALVRVESWGDKYAMSPTGPMWIVQLSHWIYGPNEYGGPVNPFNPEEAINRGAEHLADLIQKYDGNKRLAFTAYNQGETVVNKALKEWGLVTLPAEGQKYANLIKKQGGVGIV